MKKILNVLLLSGLLMLPLTSFAQKKDKDTVAVSWVDKVSKATEDFKKATGEAIDTAEKKTVSSLDEFITKYEPKISNKLGALWDFTKSTTTYMFGAFVRYLVVKDGFPLLIGLLIIFVAYRIKKTLVKMVENTNLFTKVVDVTTFTEYEKYITERDFVRNRIYDKLLKVTPSILFYIVLFKVGYELLPNIYNLILLAVSPEVRVMIELTELYKGF